MNYWEFHPDDTSDEVRDLCEICYASSGLYVPPFVFSTQSKQYLCEACLEASHYTTHIKTRRNIIKDNIPERIQTVCEYHAGKKRNKLCYTHFRLICAVCHREHHTPPCKVKPLADLSWATDSELRALKDGVKSFHMEILEAMAEKTLEVKFLRNNTTDAIRRSSDEIVSKVKHCEELVKRDANDKCTDMMKTTANSLNKTGIYLKEFENLLPGIGEPDSHVHATKISKAVDLICMIGDYSKSLFESLRKDTTSHFVLMFENLVCQTLCHTQQQKNDDRHRHENEKVIPVENTNTLQAINMQNHVKVTGQQSAKIDNLYAHRLESIEVKSGEDTDDCCITGLCVTDEGQILTVDCYNKKVKYLSAEGEQLSSLLMPGEPFDVSIAGTLEAVVTMWENQKRIHIISFANENLYLKSTISLRNRVLGIAAVENDFAVSCDDKIPGVMLIDRAGKTKWHQYFKEGKMLFKSPGYIIMLLIKEVPHIIVSDKDLHTLTVIKAKTGEVVKVCYLSKTGPYGLTSWHGNVIVSYCYSAGVCIWTPDLSEHRVLLSTSNSIKRPHAIAFNPLTNDLLLSSWRCNTMERFKIS